MDKSWYFYNSMTKNQGKNEFQRRWGARKLEDDWRRRNKTTFSLTEEEGLEDETEGESGLPGDSTLTPEQKAEAEKNSRPKTIPINLNITSNRFPRLQKRYRRQTM